MKILLGTSSSQKKKSTQEVFSRFFEEVEVIEAKTDNVEIKEPGSPPNVRIKS